MPNFLLHHPHYFNQISIKGNDDALSSLLNGSTGMEIISILIVMQESGRIIHENATLITTCTNSLRVERERTVARLVWGMGNSPG